MNAGACLIRPERPQDVPAISALLVAAFGGAAEARLVENLRADGDLAVSLVAEARSEIVGHVAFSPVRIEATAGPTPAFALAPLATDALWRRRGIGAALVEAGLKRLEDGFGGLVFVLGNPAYYGRFGFSAGLAAGFDVPWPGLAFQALALASGLHAERGRLVYARAFAGLA